MPYATRVFLLTTHFINNFVTEILMFAFQDILGP